ncbi:MAG: leucine-rich repeat protein [Clostridia bacterium]|nr:leucine-rich repeat protein [Clostridia bacterium]
MKREKNYKTARLIEALEYIDVRFIEEAAEKIKPRPTGQAFYGKPSRSKALRQFLALAACVLLLSAAIPAITYLANHLPDIVAFFIGDETTGTDPELTHPETPAPETTVPSPETTEETTEIYHETTEEPWPSTTAPREETASPEETTAEETASPPEPEYDGSVGLEYSIGGNAEIGWYMTLDGIGTCTDVDIVVASYYKGYPVKYIEQGAFYGQTQIKSIRLSGTVERIDSQAFRNCTSLESIYIGSGFREFNSDAFWGCGNISKIEIDPDNKFFEGVNCIIEKSRKALVRGCRTTVIPADGSVTRIDGLAFIDVHGLTSITIPEGVTSLGEDAFSGCPDLKSIHFSSTVNSFELVSVMGCDALEVITVDPKNPRFYSSGNCVIEKETGTLFLGCGGSVIPNDGSIKKIGYYAFGGNGSLVSVTVPEGVTYIDGYAFASCESLKSVYLPDSLITLGYGVFYRSSALESVRIGKNLETIGSSVFEECSKLNNLSFPKTLKRIGEMVFMDCKSLASVSFEGTGAEWKAIEKVELWNAGAAFSTVHCSDGDLELYEYDGSRGLLYVQYGSYAQLAGIGTCADKNIVIASAYNGVPVVIIEDGVFKSNKNIRSLTIPDKVHYIGKQAFAFCTSLESVVLPENLKTLGADAFNGCVALTEFTFKGTKAEWNAIEKQDGWNEDCPFTVVHCSDGDLELYEYDGSRGLEYRIDGDHAVLVGIGTCTDKDIVTATTYNGLPVTGIDSFEISGNKGITSVTVSEGVTHIEVCAFSGCPDLRAVYLPSTLQFLSAGEGIAFENCDNIDTIKVADSNPKYYSVGNCLIERGTGNLVLACSKSVLPSDGSIKSIGQFAFGGSDSLEKIVIPEGVTVINPYAFAGCASLKSVTFPDSLTTVRWDAFANCTSLESVKLGDNVTEIGSRVFSGCSSLVDITLPGRVDSFGEEIFAGCPIESIVIPDGVKTLHGGMFANCRKLKSVTLPDGIETIVGFAFAYCSSLEKITLPRSVTKIQGEVFADCSNLTEFTFKGTKAEWNAIEKQDGWNDGCPFTVIHCSDGDLELYEYDGSRGLEYRVEGDHAVLVGIGTCTDKEIIVASTYNGLPVTAIGRKAIYSLDGITRVVISDTVTHLDYMAIAWCSDLESIHIPANLTTMEEYAIIAFGNIRSITVDPNNPNYYSVNNCLINRKTKTLILGCDTSIIPTDGSISAIAPKAFTMCDGIESITIPEGVTKIGEDAFYDCSALKSIELPESLITIDSSAFANCSSLQNVKLGGKVEYMGDYVFSECVKLGEIILPDSLSFLGNYAFQGCTALKHAVLSSNLETLALMIFASCTNLEDVIIPEGVKTISTDAFSNTALKELKLPASIKAIRHGAFEYCDNLMNVSYAGTVTQWIAVEKDISWHTVGTFKKIRCSDGEMKLYSDSKDEGSLGLEYEINTDGKSARLISEGICTDAKIVVAAKFHGLPVTEIYSVALSNCDFIEEIVIPEGVTVIRNQAFKCCVNLKKITLPSTLEYIYDSAFADCESLVSIVIPREVKLIETWAFRDCKNLTKFTFAGTVAEWNAVQKGLGNNWNEDCPFTVIHCSDGDVLAEPMSYDEATELARQYWSPIESGYFVCYASYEMYLLVRPDEVIVDRIYIDRYTGEISKPKLTYPDIPDPLLKVLLNETTYIRQFDYESEGYFKDTILDYPTAETGSFGYAVCDLDGDGKEELILSSMQYEIVLREFEGKVYGYLFDFRSLLDLKTDGSFNFTSNAGMTYGTARLNFDGTKHVYGELTRREYVDNGSISYFVDDKKVTKEEFDAREALLSQEEAPYEHLAIYPLRAWFPGG